MKDYTKLYPGRTPVDARYQYAHDLMRRYCKGSYAKNDPDPCACHNCEFYLRMDEPKACGWAVDSDPEKAIRVLEDLLDIPLTPEYDTAASLRRIAEVNGVETVMHLLQEECAELIQAISKWFRGSSQVLGRDERHVFEEMADVEILLDEFRALVPYSGNEIGTWRDKKIGRTLERLGLGLEEEG